MLDGLSSCWPAKGIISSSLLALAHFSKTPASLLALQMRRAANVVFHALQSIYNTSLLIEQGKAYANAISACRITYIYISISICNWSAEEFRQRLRLWKLLETSADKNTENQQLACLTVCGVTEINTAQQECCVCGFSRSGFSDGWMAGNLRYRTIVGSKTTVSTVFESTWIIHLLPICALCAKSYDPHNIVWFCTTIAARTN